MSDGVKRITVKQENMEPLKRLFERGYLIGSGKTTNVLTRALRKAGVSVVNAWSRDRKVVLALEKRISIRPVVNLHPKRRKIAVELLENAE